MMWSTLERKVNTLSEALDGKTETLGRERVTIEKATGDVPAGSSSQGGDHAAAAAALSDDSAPPSAMTDEYCSALCGSSGQKKRARAELEGGSEDGQPAKKPAKVFSIFAKQRSKGSEVIRVQQPAGPWACEACSFLNAKPGRLSCEMCATKRPLPQKKAAAEGLDAPVDLVGPSGASTQVGGGASKAAAQTAEEQRGQVQELLFAVSEHAGRVHVFRHPTAAEAAEEVDPDLWKSGAIRPQPIKLCTFHPLELPAAEHADTATALAKLPVEMRTAGSVDQAVKFCTEFKQLNSIQQAKLTGRPVPVFKQTLLAAVLSPPRLVRSVVPEWGAASARETKTVETGGASGGGGEARPTAGGGLKRQATDGSTTRETDPQAWLQRHTSAAVDEAAAAAPVSSQDASKGSDAGSEGDAVVVAPGVGELDVYVHSWTERAKKTKAKAGKDAPAPREWQQAFERSTGSPCCVLCLTPYAEADRVKYDTAFCSQECSVEFSVRSSQGAARRQLYATQKGVCQKCGLDAHDLFERIAVLTPAERYQELLRLGYRLPRSVKSLRKLLAHPEEGDFWQADHIVPVSGGGGECDLSNYQTLCAGCHEVKTNDDRVNVKLQKAAEGVSDIRGFMTQRDA